MTVARVRQALAPDAVEPAAGGEHDRLAAGLLDLLERALGERVRVNGELLGELAVAEDLDAVVAALDQARVAERALVDVGAGGEAPRARRR